MAFDAGSITATLGLDTDPFARGMLRAQGIMSVFPQSVTTFLANPLLGVINIAQEVGGAFADMAKRGIASAAQMEQNAIAFEVMLGSAERAKKVLAELTEFGAKTPFELPGLVEASKSLVAMDTPAEELLDTISRLGDLAMGSEEKLKSLAMVYGQVRMAGKLQGQDLNQFINAGVPLVRALAAELGRAQSEVKDLVSEGEVGFDDVRAAIRRLTNEGGAFYGMNQRMSQGLTGLYSTMKDAWNDVERQLGQALIQGGEGKSLLNEITREVETIKPELVEFGATLASAFKNALPYIRDVMNWAKDALHMLGLVDRYKAAGSPMEGADKASLVNQYGKNPEDLQRMQKLYVEQANAAIEGFKSAKRMNDGGFGPLGMGAVDPELKKDADKLIEEFRQNAEKIDRESLALNDMINRASAGESIDDKQFNQARQRLAELLQFADKFRELNNRAQLAGSASNLVPQADVDVLEARNKRIREIMSQSTVEIDRLRGLERAAQKEAKEREEAWKQIVQKREAEDAARQAERDAMSGNTGDGGTKPSKGGASVDRELQREESERRRAAQRAADLAFEAEKTRIERELSASQARIAIFDLETKHREAGIENLTELWEYQMLRIQQRESLVADIAADAADSQRRIAEFDRETDERLDKIRGKKDPRLTQHMVDDFTQQREEQRQAMIDDIARREASPTQRAGGVGVPGIEALLQEQLAKATSELRNSAASTVNIVVPPPAIQDKPATDQTPSTAALEARIDKLAASVDRIGSTLSERIGMNIERSRTELEEINRKTVRTEGEGI